MKFSTFSTFILVIIVLVTSSVNQIDALRCYACSYVTASSGTACVDDPASVEGQSIVTCSKKYCTILRQELTDPPGKVNSFLRDCQERPLYLNDVIEDPTFTTYYRSCTTDLCNSGDGTGSGTLTLSVDGGPGGNLAVPGLNDCNIVKSFSLFFYIILAILTIL